jgi:hypothetical protein
MRAPKQQKFCQQLDDSINSFGKHLNQRFPAVQERGVGLHIAGSFFLELQPATWYNSLLQEHLSDRCGKIMTKN